MKSHNLSHIPSYSCKALRLLNIYNGTDGTYNMSHQAIKVFLQLRQTVA